MALVNCSECKREISDQAGTCPHCGAPALKDSEPIKKKGGLWRWVLGLPTGIFAIMVLYQLVNPNPEKDRARRAYDLCMSDLASADRARNGSSSFIAGTCEAMRSEFVRKYGVSP